MYRKLLTKFLKNLDKKVSFKFPFVFLFFCYWINTYSTLGSKIIIYLSSEDNFIEYCSFLLILFSAFYVFRTIQIKKVKILQTSKNSILIFLFLFLIFWAIEEVSWGERIFNFSWDSLANINSQSELNIHNLKIIQPHLHKGYYIVGLLLSVTCILKKKSKSSLLPDKSLLYFFLLPSLYYLVGEFFVNFPIEIRGAYVLRSHMFFMQEPNEFLFSLGTFLYSLRLYKVAKNKN